MQAQNDQQFASYALAMERVFSRSRRRLTARIVLIRHRTKFFCLPCHFRFAAYLGIVTEAFAVLRHE
jgi:hypothetical protein